MDPPEFSYSVNETKWQRLFYTFQIKLAIFAQHVNITENSKLD